ISRGQLLDTGTPSELVERRGLRAAEIQVDAADALVPRLRADARVEEVAHYGHRIRVCTKQRADPLVVVRECALPGAPEPSDAREVRPTVEDAFVAMVREEERAASRGEPLAAATLAGVVC
ncbi:MAG TPA: hypothetical protein VNN80_20180, partial [Polyangiaceae bacterium]|nr:hypothetical protein [Polyangiaceae bacterium]